MSSPAGNVKHLSVVARLQPQHSARVTFIISLMNISAAPSSFLTFDSWKQIPVSINGAAAWSTLTFLPALYLCSLDSGKPALFYDHWRFSFVFTGLENRIWIHSVRPCRSLGGNSCEARSNDAASSPYWQHLGLVFIIYYRFCNIFKIIFHRSINAGLPSVAIHRPECPHHTILPSYILQGWFDLCQVNPSCLAI